MQKPRVSCGSLGEGRGELNCCEEWHPRWENARDTLWADRGSLEGPAAITVNPIHTLASLYGRDRLLRSMDIQGLEELSQSLHFYSFHSKSGSCWKASHEGHIEIFQRGHLILELTASQTQKLPLSTPHGSLNESLCVPVTVLGIGAPRWIRQFQPCLEELAV